MSLEYKQVETPVGALRLVASETGLAAILWSTDQLRRVPLEALSKSTNNPWLDKAETQLHEYFAGQRKCFDVPLDLRGTSFQRQVWQALLQIPFGETRTYGEIAAGIGTPDAVRAVGAANGRNPVSIVVPCHRVIGASGKLTGFAGGLQAKQYLLAHEARRAGLFATEM